MTRDDITRMAREAGFVGFDGDNGSLRRFAALVAQHEREACVQVCEEKAQQYRGRAARPEGERDIDPEVARVAALTCEFVVDAIRARGEKE